MDFRDAYAIIVELITCMSEARCEIYVTHSDVRGGGGEGEGEKGREMTSRRVRRRCRGLKSGGRGRGRNKQGVEEEQK